MDANIVPIETNLVRRHNRLLSQIISNMAFYHPGKDCHKIDHLYVIHRMPAGILPETDR